MVGKDAVRILNRPAFHDIQLTSSGDLSYLGQQWRRDVAFAGYNVPIQVPSQPASQPERGNLVSTLRRHGLDFVPACDFFQHVSLTAVQSASWMRHFLFESPPHTWANAASMLASMR